MKRFLTLSALILASAYLSGQSCLPDGIEFTTQEQIDNFQVNYPGCTEIEGDAEIYGDNITNLDSLISISSIGGSLIIGSPYNGNPNLISIEGLSQLQFIGGDLSVAGNDNLTSLAGIDNLASIGGDLSIIRNTKLMSLQGLENLSVIEQSLVISKDSSLVSLSGLNGLTFVGERVTICFNPELQSFDGLNNLSYIGVTEGWWSLEISGNTSLINFEGLDNLTMIMGDFCIGDNTNQNPGFENPSLKNFSGLQNLTYIGGDLAVYQNDSLLSLSGLDNLNIIQGDLILYGNDTLIDLTALDNLQIVENIGIYENKNLQELTGLDNIIPESLGNLSISYNPQLSYCELQSLCNYLVSPNGTVNIHHNDSGCNNPVEIANNCGNTMPCLPYGNYWFITQADVDSFQYFYPDCSELGGEVWIGEAGSGTNISNLNGLSVINSVDAELRIFNNDSLQNLMGLNNLTSIGGPLRIIMNDSLQNLIGLENLIFIGGDRFVLSGNNSIINLTGLDDLEIVNGTFYIHYNDSLTDLSGLENVNLFGTLDIGHNPNLNSLSGLNNAVNLNGLIIRDNSSLITLPGLEMITSVDGPLYIDDNSSLTNLSGLDNLLSISGDLSITNNDNLMNLNNLSKLTSINGKLAVWGNDVINSLSGLENIEDESISNLYIGDNSMLEYCHVYSICSYLANPSGEIRIENNASGCNSQEEVEEACEWVNIEEYTATDKPLAYPNPSSGTIHLRYSILDPRSSVLEIYSLQGIKVRTLLSKIQPPGEYEFTFDISDLPAGMFFVRMQIGQRVETVKVVKVGSRR